MYAYIYTQAHKCECEHACVHTSYILHRCVAVYIYHTYYIDVWVYIYHIYYIDVWVCTHIIHIT